jgi:hypothetical protein
MTVNMSNDHSPEKRTLGQTLNTWVQTVGICIAALWGVYTFVYKEIKIPKSAPVNITLNLQLKKIGTGPAKANLTAVEMKVSATNPSTREIHLLPSAWIAYGVGIGTAESNDAHFKEEITAAFQDPNTIYTAQRHARQEKSLIVATGLLFADEVLKPSETAARTILFYVPKDDYDLVDVSAVMPSAADTRSTKLDWTINEDDNLEPTLYHIDKNGKSTPIPKDKTGQYSNKRLELQTAEATAAISLWP